MARASFEASDVAPPQMIAPTNVGEESVTDGTHGAVAATILPASSSLLKLGHYLTVSLAFFENQCYH
jgi:hypothetical protein